VSEDEARQWVIDRFGVSRETALAALAALILDESTRQNLLSASSADQIWRRHIVDSAQLVPLAGAFDGPWIDIGTGAGFPGLVVAILVEAPVLLIEPRRRRADFLCHTIDHFGLAGRVACKPQRAEHVSGQAAIISARAVAALPALLQSAAHLAHHDTLWLLPKGQSAREEVAAAQQTWHGSFHVEPSVTEPGSLIITAKGVARR